MKQEQYDVVIIGSGIGGLSAAALSAREGYQILVVESLPEIGGLCSTLEYRGFKIPTGVWLLPVHGIVNDFFKEVGADYDVRAIPAPCYRIEGKDYQLPEHGQFRALLTYASGDEVEVQKVIDAFRQAQTWAEPSGLISLSDWVRNYTDNDGIVSVLETVACSFLGPNANEIPAKSFIEFRREMTGYYGVAGHAPKGNLAMMKSLAKVIEAKGGHIWTRCRAKQILVADGVVSGVVVEKGNEAIIINASAVISNAGPRKTVKLVGAENLDRGYLEDVMEKHKEGPGMAITTISDRPLINYEGGLIVVGARRLIGINCLTLTCPELAPLGRHMLCSNAPMQSTATLQDVKKEVGLHIQDLTDNIPGFDEHAEVLHVGCFRGEWPGYQALPGFNLPQKTPIENLYNVGGGVAPVGWMGIPGCVKTAEIVFEDVKNALYYR